MADVWLSEPDLMYLLGEEGTKLLLGHYGGLRQYVPTTASPQHPFAKLLGMPAMRALASAYGGACVSLPNGRRAEPYKGEILNMLRKGVKAADIARKLPVTERWVYRVAAESGQQCMLPLG